MAQATANSESDVKAWLAAAINGLAGMSGTGITVAANDIAVTGFTAATAGNADAPSGADGSFTFTVALSKGTANATANQNASITATAYSAPGGSSGQGDPSGPSGESESAGAAIQALAKPKIPAAKPEAPAAGLELPTAGATQPMTPDQNGGVTVKHDAVSAAISAAKQDAQQKGSLNSGVAVTVPVNTAAGQSILNVTIPAPTLDELVGEQVIRFDLTTNDMVSYSFSRDTLAQLDANSQGAHIVLRAEKRAELIGAARAAVGSRPVYDVTMIYLESGKEVPASTLNGKTITIKLPYVLQEWEDAGNLYAVYVDDAGKVHWLTRSAYDPSQKAVIFEAPHFSVYGVAYKPAPVFTDTAGHWAKSDIDFAAGRGLLTGTGETTFGPDAPITRGMFAAALGRLAGIDPAAYPSSGRFADVAATAFCAPFVEWAVVQGIISGAGENTFRPDAAITREQMAAILCRYADRLGYTLPVSREAEIFADAGQIAGGMKEAVRAVQQAGVMSAKGGRCFAPNNSATRAEAAAALHRFVESVVNPSPAQGWVQNDAGRFLYYQGGKPTIGWKQVEGNWYYFDAAGLMECGGWRQIDGKRYYFFPGGALAANAKINDRRLEPGGARKKNRQQPPA